MPVQLVLDRRVEKTRRHLREALASLISEKSYDDIVVKEILARANVGRSTFYTHFRDKDELLESGIHDMLGPVRSAPDWPSRGRGEAIIRWSLPVFQYIDQHRKCSPGGSVRSQEVVHHHLEEVLTGLVGEELRRLKPGAEKELVSIPPLLIPRYVASTFILVLNWWVGTRRSLTPLEVNDIFRALVVPTLESGRT